MKLAFVSLMTAAPWGGSEALWSATARHALDAGCAAVLCTHDWEPPPGPIAQLMTAGATWAPRRAPAAPPPRTWRERTMRRFRAPDEPLRPSVFQPIFDFAPDIVCISQGGTFDFLLHEELVDLLRDSALPYVVLCRFNADDLLVHEELLPRAVAFLSSASHVAFAAARNRATAERQLAARLPRASVVQSPLQLPDFAAVPWPDAEAPHLACVARLDALYKGQDLLLESLAAPVWRDRSWRLSFYGDGPDRARLERLVRFFDLADRVRFAGHVTDIRGIWRDCHLLVLPSRAEGTPQGLLQAMICGRPAVVTDVGGVCEWARDGSTAFMAAAPSVDAIGGALERAWEARGRWPEIGRAAHAAALDGIDRAPHERLFRILMAAAAGELSK